MNILGNLNAFSLSIRYKYIFSQVRKMLGKTLVLNSLILFIAQLSGTANAHHSFSLGFTHEEATMRGVVTKVWFRNPHVRLYFTVTDEIGAEERWEAQALSINMLSSKGWTKKTFQPGDKVEIHGALGEDGKKKVFVLWIRKEGGERIFPLPEGYMLND